MDDVAERNCPDVEEQSPEVVLKSSRVLQPEDEDVAGNGYEVEVDQDLRLKAGVAMFSIYTINTFFVGYGPLIAGTARIFHHTRCRDRELNLHQFTHYTELHQPGTYFSGCSTDRAHPCQFYSGSVQFS